MFTKVLYSNSYKNYFFINLIREYLFYSFSVPNGYEQRHKNSEYLFRQNIYTILFVIKVIRML